MSVTTGPYVPKKGWLTRWTVQAGALLLRYPLASMIGLCGILICSVIIDLCFGILSGFLSEHYSGAVTIVLASIPGVCVPVAICAYLGISEGHGMVNRLDLVKGLRNILAFVYVFISVVIGFAMVILQILIFVELPSNAYIASRTGMDIFFGRGLTAIAMAILVTIWVNALWVSLVTQVPMSLGQTFSTGEQIRLKSQYFFPWLAIFIGMILMNIFAYFIHVIIAVPAMIFFIAWLYVAGREIFGGISVNRASVAETDTSLARA